MTDRALTEDSAHSIDHVMRGEAGRLIDNYNTVHKNL
jgi:hypothetical protein